MSEKKESTTKKLGRFLGKKVVDAGNLIDREIRKAGRIAREELRDLDVSNVVVEPPKKPKDESRIHFTRRARPTKTYTSANRTIQIFAHNPEKKEINPGIDGLVSFSILVTPFALLIGALILFVDFNEILGLFLLFIYCLLIAIPGAYLGLDAIFIGAKSVIKGGTATIIAIVRGFFEFIYLMIQGFTELCLIFINAFFGFAKGAFETLADYIVFIVVYVIFAGGIWIIIQALSIDINSFIVLGFIVLLPALLPASIAHRFWLLWKLNRNS
jgi:hypothetical protein